MSTLIRLLEKALFKVSGIPFRISAVNAGTFLIARADLRAEALQKLAHLVRNLQVFQNTGAPLAPDLDDELAEIVGTFTDPSLIETSNLEHELYLTVSILTELFKSKLL